MLKGMTIGQYFPGDSFVHRLDPRTKLLATIALIAVVFVSRGFAGFALITAFVLLVAASTGLGYMIMYARQFGQTDVVIVGMLMIGIIGKVMDSLLMAIEKRVIRWK